MTNRRCGHYLHHHWGCGRASQMQARHILEDCGETAQRSSRQRPDRWSSGMYPSGIRNIGVEELRRNITIVLQNAVLFSDTIRNNLKYPDRNACRPCAYAHMIFVRSGGLPDR